MGTGGTSACGVLFSCRDWNVDVSVIVAFELEDATIDLSLACGRVLEVVGTGCTNPRGGGREGVTVGECRGEVRVSPVWTRAGRRRGEDFYSRHSCDSE